MELVPVTCNHCGASLEISDGARFVTCRYCNSQLEIKRTESTITTQVLHRIDENTASMAQDLHALRRESELERLDREWNQRRAALMIKDKHGNQTTPTTAGGIAGAFIMGVFGLFWTIFAFVITSPSSAPSFPSFPGMPASAFPAHQSFGPPPIIHFLFPLFGVFFMAAAVVIGIKTTTAARQYEDEQRQYQLRRRQLLEQQESESQAASNSQTTP